ncbi:MAG: replication protein, partial [Bacillota bacterium]|nr:replication protein [Bacillota bacterium]
MNTYKQIQASFWQNAFVLDLTPEEKYFYIYLITNTKTTACGIYRFNLKLAVLETGLNSEKINNYLSSFESSGKIVVSKATGEIMIINWLKHNPKRNKRIIGQINSELKEVKDKELLKRFYESCRNREYPVEE